VATVPVPQPLTPGISVMLTVPAGGFKMGNANGSEEERPEHNVTIAAFAIDKTEVTVGQYRDCVNANECKAPGKGLKCNYHEAGRNAHPVNCVSWGQAQQYCEWAGKRLCTEAEWEKAARGTEGQAFPWGNEPASCRTAVLQEGGPGCGKQTTAPVGSKATGRSPYGVEDLIGNVWEWVADYFDKGYYAASPAADPKGPDVGSARVIRGGGFSTPATLTTSTRQGLTAPTQINFVGFRCCK
jgi:formylglycine-generating enzyme